MPPEPAERKPRGVCRLYQAGNCRYGTKCKFLHELGQNQTTINSKGNPAGSSQHLGIAVAPVASASSPSPTQSTVRNENVIKPVLKVDKPCRAWKGGSCSWGNQCHFLHEMKTPSTQGVSNDSETGGGGGACAKGARRKRGKGKQPTTPAVITNSQNTTTGGTSGANSGAETLRRVQQQIEFARMARMREELLRQNQEEAARKLQEEEAARKAQEEMAARRAQEEEAARRAQEEAARLIREQVVAARRERQAQLAREREEAKERERQVLRRRQEEEWARESVMTIQQVILNSFVKFEAGLAVQHVICGFEASRILIRNLPVSATKPEIIQLFTQQGVEEEDLVILRTETAGNSQQVTVLGKAEDVETVAIGLDGIEFRDKNLDFVVCERSSEGRTMGSSNRNSYHLSISWRPAFLTMLARYPHLESWDISQKARELDRKVVNGRSVRAELHTEPQNMMYHDFDYYLPPARNAIKISKIPNGTTIEMVRVLAGTQSVEVHHDPSSYTTNDVFNAVEAHLRSLAGSTLATINLENNARPNTIFVKAIFGSWDGAKSAHDSLSGRILRPHFPSLRLFLSDPYRFVITIDEKQFNAQRGQWTELSGGKGQEATIQIKEVDRAGGKRAVITLFGRDKKVVGALKVRIESMAAGQKLDAAYWHPTFKYGKGQDFLNGLYDTTGAYVRCDKKYNCVAVYGRVEAVEGAKSRIKEEVERISSEEWTIPLQRRALGFFIREGLAKMKALLGEENVTLDVGSAKIILRGADLEEARHHLRQLMDAFLDQSSLLTAASDDKLCPICYDTVSQPIELSCEHIYCSPCLRHYVLSSFDNQDFPLKCMGGDATCNKPLSLPLVRKFLPPQRFEQLLETAFTSYLEKNPETFKYCNTPDCSQVYRATALRRELQCPSCFSEVCTACHEEGHAGMTCAENRQHKDPGEQERLLEAWATENSVKRCPSCRAWVEKAEGCNHITCKCGIHFCWICSGVFDGARIYDHMTEAHGNWYNDPGRNGRQAAAGQPQVPDIVQIAGGAAAVAEQAAELRRLERERLDRVARVAARLAPPANPAAQIQPVAPIFQGQARNVEQDRYQEQLRLLQQARRRQELIDEAEQRQRVREANQRLLMEQEARRRREQDRGWCVIM